MLHGVSGARFSYLTFPRLASYCRIPCQLWHVQQYLLSGLVSVMLILLSYYLFNSHTDTRQGEIDVYCIIAVTKISCPVEEINPCFSALPSRYSKPISAPRRALHQLLSVPSFFLFSLFCPLFRNRREKERAQSPTRFRVRPAKAPRLLS